MKKIFMFAAAALLLWPGVESSAQISLTLVSLDQSSLPTLKAELKVTGAAGRPLPPDPLFSEFAVRENGAELRQITSVLTETDYVYAQTHALLFVLDVSGSMSERPAGTNKTRLDVMRDAILTVLQNYEIGEGNPVAITAFASILDTGYSSWTSYPVLAGDGLLTSNQAVAYHLQRITAPRGGTNYNAPFFDKRNKYTDSMSVMTRLRFLPEGAKPVVIFMTDGIHVNASGSDTVRTHEISDSLRRFGAVMHSFLMYTDGVNSPDLQRISQQTNGRYFSISNEAELTDALASVLPSASVIDSTKRTFIEWKAMPVCSADLLTRNAEIIFTRGANSAGTELQYTLPVSYLKQFNLGSNWVAYSFPHKVETGASRTVTLKDLFCNTSVAPIAVSSVEVRGSNEFTVERSVPFTVEPGACLPDFQLTFSPVGNSGTRSANIVFISECQEADLEVSAEALTAVSAEEIKRADIDIAPNPSNGHLVVRNLPFPACDLVVTDLLGNRIFHIRDFTGGTVELGGIPAGTYFLILTGENGASHQVKILVY